MTDSIFSGLKVADFTWAAAGPIVTKQLADNGATVIKVESHRHPDSIRLGGPFIDDKPGINRSGFFADFHSSKLGISVDMGHEEAARVITPLVRWADIVAESFRPGIMARWGLDYENLRKINPRLIMLSSSLYGADGSWASHPGYGAQGQALAGLHSLTGWPDRPPAVPKGAYTDAVSPRYGAAALVAALIHREKTGEGQHIELSQIETTVELLAPQLLQYQITGEVPRRSGNDKPEAMLHGVYPCRGDERWIAVEVEDREQWRAFVETLFRQDSRPDQPLGVEDPGLLDKAELDEAVAGVTRDWEAQELMAALRAAGVPAGIAYKASDLLSDEVLRARGHFWPLEHQEMGTLEYNGPAYRFEHTPPKLTRAAPMLGEHTEEVLQELLGFSQTEIGELRSLGVLE